MDGRKHRLPRLADRIQSADSVCSRAKGRHEKSRQILLEAWLWPHGWLPMQRHKL